MRGVNKVILVGRLGNDPEVRYLPSGNAVTNISVATSEAWKDKTTGEPQERTEWHRVAIFGKIAELTGQYLRKGSQVYVEGKLRTRKWQAQDGQDRYTTEVIVDIGGNIQFLDSRGQGAGQGPSYGTNQPRGQAGAGDDSGAAGGAPVNDRTAAEANMAAGGPIGGPTDTAGFDDDIPF